MKKTTRFLLVSLSIALIWACAPTSEKSETTPPETQELIAEGGLSFVQLSMPINEIDFSSLGEGIEVNDFVDGEAGYKFVSREVKLPEGSVVIEGRYIEEDLANDSLLSYSKVNRIKIRSPLFATPTQLTVGSTIADIRKAVPDQEWSVTSYADYETIVIVSDSEKSYAFHLQDKGNSIANSIEELNISTLPQDLKIYEIVMM